MHFKFCLYVFPMLCYFCIFKTEIYDHHKVNLYHCFPCLYVDCIGWLCSWVEFLCFKLRNICTFNHVDCFINGCKHNYLISSLSTVNEIINKAFKKRERGHDQVYCSKMTVHWIGPDFVLFVSFLKLKCEKVISFLRDEWNCKLLSWTVNVKCWGRLWERRICMWIGNSMAWSVANCLQLGQFRGEWHVCELKIVKRSMAVCKKGNLWEWRICTQEQ